MASVRYLLKVLDKRDICCQLQLWVGLSVEWYPSYCECILYTWCILVDLRGFRK